ncbi:hypothetical protein Tco_0806919 [Tanacetum coccineum]
MDDTIDQFDDDADARLEEPIETATRIIQDIPQTDAEIVSPLDVHIQPIEITVMEKEVVDLKKYPLHTQVTSLVDSHLDTRLGETREEFMNILSKSVMARIKEQVKDQLPQILTPGNDASTLTEFELKKILLDKIETSESYLTAPEHQDCYDDQNRRVKESRKNEQICLTTTGPKKKDSTSRSSKGTKSQPKSTGKSVQSEENQCSRFQIPNMPTKRSAGNLVDNEDEPKMRIASSMTWFKNMDMDTWKRFVMRRTDNSIIQIQVKKINVTKPDTTRPDLRKRHPYTPYKDPQGFIYVDDHKRNRLMRSDELYKFSDGTLTRLLSLLKEITRNIDMEYLPKRRWSNLEKKRAHFMIRHQQAAKGKEVDEEFGEIRGW